MSIASEITRLRNAKAALKESIEAKGVTVKDAIKLDEYSALVDNIPQGGGGVEEKDVNFYDYDGTCVYSYTKDEFLALSEMPALPDHSDEGAIADKWSCTFEYARIAAKMGKFYIVPFYKINKNLILFTSFDITINFKISLMGNGSCDIDFGDGNIETVRLSANILTIEHEFLPGNYIISFNSPNSIALPYNTSGGTFLGNDYESAYKTRFVKKIFFGKVSTSTFGRYFNSDTIILIDYTNPETIYWSEDTIFNIYGYMNKLSKSFNIPVLYLYNLTMTSNVPPYSKFCSCINCPDVFPPNNIKILYIDNITTRLFYTNNISGLELLVCFATTPPTLSAVTNLQYRTTLKIYVPAESVNTYKAATNWSALADKIFPIPTE